MKNQKGKDPNAPPRIDLTRTLNTTMESRRSAILDFLEESPFPHDEEDG